MISFSAISQQKMQPILCRARGVQTGFVGSHCENNSGVIYVTEPDAGDNLSLLDLSTHIRRNRAEELARLSVPRGTALFWQMQTALAM